MKSEILENNELIIPDDTISLKQKLETLKLILEEKKLELYEYEKQIDKYYRLRKKSLYKTELKVLKLEKKLFDLGYYEFEDAEENYEEYEKIYNEIEEPALDLNQNQEAELKSLFKNLIKKVHPDKFQEAFHKQCNELVHEITKAYKSNDISRLKEIEVKLKKGTNFKSKSEILTDIDILKSQVKALEGKIEDIEKDIENYQNNDTYKMVSGIKNFKKHFAEEKEELIAYYRELESILQDYKKNKNKE